MQSKDTARLLATEEALLRFSRDGFCATPQLFTHEQIQRVIPRMDAVIAGEYETGVPPHAVHFSKDDEPDKIRKVDQPHLCDRAIHEFIASPAVGRWAAALTGARMVQIFAVQLLVKPTGGRTVGHVGWHQDKMYWPYWHGTEGLLTAWVALSDVTENAGPIRFVPGSHRWGLCEGGDFFEINHETHRRSIRVPSGGEWREVTMTLHPGEVSFHHCLTFHASGPNLESYPRRSFALHLRTDQTSVAESSYYTQHLDDPLHAPVIFGETKEEWA